ncbi:DUF4397 domain-containing protein [Anaerolineae bacterium CFX9]|nr:DUF4397 domain-containing protein [Anaerolineae bacterium CFX9]
MRRLLAILLVLALAVTAIVPAFAQERPDIPTLLAEDGRFGTLLAAVEAAGLGDALSGEGPFTLLAPTDDAFAAALEALGLTAEDLLADTETLTEILTYHVIPGRYFFRNLTGGPTVETLQGDTITFNLERGVFTAEGVQILDVDNVASNGIVHIAEGVLLPPALRPTEEAAAEEQAAAEPEVVAGVAPARPNIPELLAADGRFGTLLAAVEAAGLGDALSGEGPFTLLAPTDDAIASTLEFLGISAADLLGNPDLLTEILTYHVLPGRYFFRDLTSGPTLETLQDSTVDFDLTRGVFSANNVNIVDVDNMASNGIVHVLEGVIVPPGVGLNAYVRIAHFSPDAPAVDVYVNGAVAISNLEFGSVTDWIERPVGVYDFAVAPAGTSLASAVISLPNQPLAPGSYTTAAAIGSAANGTLQAALIPEDYSSVTQAHVTLFHAIEGAPAVNIIANGTTVVFQLGYPGTLGDNDGVFTLDVPAGTYNFAVTAGGATLLSADGVQLEAGKSYFIAAIGTPDAPQLSLSVTDVAGMGM